VSEKEELDLLKVLVRMEPLGRLGLSHFESVHSGRRKKRLSGENGELSDGIEDKRMRRDLD
jgi:hypothetical protein